jgi:hypothetical protein
MHTVPLVAAPSPSPLFTFAQVTVQAEVSLLWTLVDVIPALSLRGDDNREAIEAQLSVLVDELDLLQVLVEFDRKSTDAYVLRAAIHAAVWLQEGGEPPSTGWLQLASNGPFTQSHRGSSICISLAKVDHGTN